MALDKNRLGDAMTDTVLACLSSSPIAADTQKLRDLMRGLADNIIQEFISNAVIESTGTTGPTASPGTPTPIPALPGVIKE